MADMPLSWKIAPLEQMVICTAEATVMLPDMLAYFTALDQAGAFPYQKIFIATAGVSGLSREDLDVVARELQSRRKRGRFGEVAVVAGASRNNGLANIFRTLSRVDRPLFICATIHDARRWLARRRASRPGSRTRS
jgi:hypothetical protein